MDVAFEAFSWMAGAVIAVTAIEMVCLATWNRFYFRVGPAWFRDAAEGFSPGAPLPTADSLSRSLDDGRYLPFAFHALDADTFAFRESFRFDFGRGSYTPMMRGVLRFDRRAGRVEVVGLANFFPTLMILLFVVMALMFPTEAAAPGELLITLVAVLIPSALLVWLFRIQLRRYRRIAATAATLWSSGVIQGS